MGRNEAITRYAKGDKIMKCPVCKSEITHMKEEHRIAHYRKCRKQEREHLAEMYDPKKDVSRDL